MDNQKEDKEKGYSGIPSANGKIVESLQDSSSSVSGEYDIEIDDEDLTFDASLDDVLNDVLAQFEEEEKINSSVAQQKPKETQPKPQTNESKEKGSTGALLTPELLAARAELKRVECEKQELVELLKRRQADFDNYRKRIERDRSDSFNRIVSDVAGKLLPVMDNMQHALEAHKVIDASETPEFQNFVQGVELIFSQLNDVLSSLGVKPIPTVGEKFDPHVHEAVTTEVNNEYDPKTVTQELRRGYNLGDILIRPAMVKVSVKE